MPNRKAVHRCNHSWNHVDLVPSIMDAHASGDYTSIQTSVSAAATINPDPTYTPAPIRTSVSKNQGEAGVGHSQPAAEEEPPTDGPTGSTNGGLIPGGPKVTLPTPADPADHRRHRRGRHPAVLHHTLDGYDENILTDDDFDTCAADYRARLPRHCSRAWRPTILTFAPTLPLMLFAGLRPAEARNVRRRDLELPEKGWGWVLLHSTAQVSGSAWTNDGRATEQRPLKHRSQSETRRVPLNKRAVKILRAHLDSYPCGPDGHLFVSRTGKAGKPLSPPHTSLVSVETIGRAWSRARLTALSPEQVDSVLARRPYDLRHARLTWWLNAGVPPTQVAKWAGHSVRVLLDVYAGCVDGGEKQALLLLKQD